MVSQVRVDCRSLGVPEEEWVDVSTERIGEFYIAGALRKKKKGGEGGHVPSKLGLICPTQGR